MTGISFGDLSQAHFLRRHNAMLKADMQTASRELTTGRVADITAKLNGDLGELSAVDTSLAKLQGYRSVNQSLTLTAGVMQTTLGVIDSAAKGLTSTMLLAGTSVGASTIDQAARSAQDAFVSTVSALNIRLGDKAVFSGVVSDQSPLPDAGVLLAAIDTAILGKTSAQDITNTIENWFSSPTGFGSFFAGGAVNEALNIAANEAVKLDVTALDPALRDTLKGFALAAVLDRGALTGMQDERADLLRRSGQVLAQSASPRAFLSARVGGVEARLEAGSIQNSAETSALQIARAGLVSVDQYEAATRLEMAETQLTSLYTITARLSRLSLADYI